MMDYFYTNKCQWNVIGFGSFRFILLRIALTNLYFGTAKYFLQFDVNKVNDVNDVNDDQTLR